MRKTDGSAVLVSVALLLLARTAFGFPWSTDMYRGDSVQPLAVAPRVMPAGTMPVKGGEPPMPREEAARVLTNPLQPTTEHLQHAQSMFQNTCAPCHGNGGKGDGPVRFQTILPPADLTAGIPTQRSDGFIYGTIRNGGIVMPAYGDATSSDERWELVLYVRALQQRKAPLPSPPASAPTPAAEPIELPPGTHANGAAQ